MGIYLCEVFLKVLGYNSLMCFEELVLVFLMIKVLGLVDILGGVWEAGGGRVGGG